MFMISKCNNSLWPVLALCCTMLVQPPVAVADGEMSTAEVLALLPTGADMHDPREHVNLTKLIDQGEAAYAGLLDIIRTDNSPYVAGRALAVLRNSKNAGPAARRKVVTELGKVLSERKSLTGYRDEWTLSFMAQVIADMGDAGDTMLLLPLLDHPSEEVRSAGYSAMEKLAAKALPANNPPAVYPPGQSADEDSAVTPRSGKTYMDYPEWNLLSKGIDFDDEDDIAAIRQLVDEGPAAHEAMLAIVRECDDSMIASRALATLRESAGDKRPVVEELKRIFEQRYPPATGDESWIVDGIAAAISDMGTENDMDVLVPMLTNPDIRLRVMGARYFGKRGGQSAIMVLENAKSQYAEERFRQEIDAAIANIGNRLSDQKMSYGPQVESE